MKDIFVDNKLVVASHNQGKIKEFKKILSPFNIEVLSAIDIDLPDVEETGTTFIENALLKAKESAIHCGLTVIADDSGLCVNMLDGRPGVYSARYAPNRDFDKGMDKLINEMTENGSDDWSAYFTCTLALVTPDGKEHIYEGKIDGTIITEKKGGGFGFDPIFVPNGYEKTFGELSGEEKNEISHRGLALEKFVNDVFK